MRHQTQPTVEDDDANTGDENNDVDVNIFYIDAKRKKDSHGMSGQLVP